MSTKTERALSYVRHEVGQHGKTTTFVNEVLAMRGVTAQAWKQAVSTGLVLHKKLASGASYGDIVFGAKPTAAAAPAAVAPPAVSPLRESISEQVSALGQNMQHATTQLLIDKIEDAVHSAQYTGLAKWEAQPHTWGKGILAIVRKCVETDPTIRVTLRHLEAKTAREPWREVEKYAFDSWGDCSEHENPDKAEIYHLDTLQSRLASIQNNPVFEVLAVQPRH